MHEITTETSLAESIAQRCEDYKPYKDGWRARCPAHNGQSDNSLSITPKPGRVLLYCHGGCTTDVVLQALGLSMADLFLQRANQGQIVGLFDYYDADGTLRFQVVRKHPKFFVQRRQDPVQPGKWIWNLKGVERIPYHLPELITDVAAGKTIYIPEGEKHVDALRQLGLAATCNPGGTGNWKDAYSEYLRGASVVILPDNDNPGRSHAEKVVKSLNGIAASIKVVELPGLAEKGDIIDWLGAGGTREQLESLVANTKVYTMRAST